MTQIKFIFEQHADGLRLVDKVFGHARSSVARIGPVGYTGGEVSL